MTGLIAEIRERQALPSPAEARAIREAAGVSQVRLAAELSVHWQTVHRWEAGVHAPSGDLRLAYIRLLRDLDEATRQPA